MESPSTTSRSCAGGARSPHCAGRRDGVRTSWIATPRRRNRGEQDRLPRPRRREGSAAPRGPHRTRAVSAAPPRGPRRKRAATSGSSGTGSLLCHCYYPWSVKLLEAQGPVAGFRVSMKFRSPGMAPLLRRRVRLSRVRRSAGGRAREDHARREKGPPRPGAPAGAPEPHPAPLCPMAGSACTPMTRTGRSTGPDHGARSRRRTTAEPARGGRHPGLSPSAAPLTRAGPTWSPP